MATTVNDRSLSGNDIAVYVSEQSVKGTIDTSPVFDKVRRTEGKAVEQIDYTQSGEVKSNRQGRQQIQDTRTFSSELSFEVTQQTAKFIDSAIHGTQVDNSLTTSTVGTDSLGFVSSAGDFTNLSVGDWFKVEGFVDAQNDGWYKVKSKTDNDNIETYSAPNSVEASGAVVSIESRKTTSGADQTYYAIQNRVADNSAVGNVDYQTFYDAIINTLSFEVGESGVLTGSMSMNIESLLPGTEKLTGQTDNSDDLSDAVSAINNTGKIYVDGINTSCSVKSMGIEINNNYSGDRAAGCQGEQYAYGDMDVSGSVVSRAVISNTFDWRNRFQNSQPFSLAVRFFWDDGRWMIVDIMRAKLTEHSMPDGSNVISQNDMSYGAEEDPTTGKTVQFFRNF